MTVERSDGSIATVPLGPPGVEGLDPAHRALRLQILATEHSSLLATRSLVWNEVFARAAMLLASLSGAIIALALVGQGSGFGPTFVLFALVILPVVLFVGLTTFLRLGAANYHDAQCVIGMNRIRAAYLEMAPDLEPYFVMGHHDDPAGIGLTMGVEPGIPAQVHLLAATPTLASVIDSSIAAALVGLLVAGAGAGSVAAVAAGVVTFGLVFAAHLAFGRGRVRRLQAGIRPMFATPSGDGARLP